METPDTLTVLPQYGDDLFFVHAISPGASQAHIFGDSVIKFITCPRFRGIGYA